ILIAFTVTSEENDLLINLCAGLFILPFFLFSATAGQIAEKFEKSRLMRTIKLCEIGIMIAGAIAFYIGNVTALMVILFLMGTQSTFFGPVKFSILPQHLKKDELIGGNGLVEMGTFVAILLGTMFGGLLIAVEDTGPLLIGIAIIVFAIAGWAASRFIPKAPANDPTLKINWNLFSETIKILKIAHEEKSVFQSVLGISWFWMLGAVYLTQFPNYAKTVLGGNEQVVTLLLVTFSVGVGIGSLLCEKLSGRLVELGLVPFGSIGLSLFGFDLFFASGEFAGGPLIGAAGFMSESENWRVIIDLLMIGVFGGFYIVPLYAIVQSRSKPKHRSRVIAANNILNALFMVAAAGLAIGLLAMGLTIPQLFLVMAALNVLTAIYIYTLVPEFLMRFLVWIMISVMYRIKLKDLDHIPEEGGALLVCNHVSYVDAMVIAGSIRRPVRFVMDHNIFKIPVFGFIFRTAGAISIAPRKVNEATYEAAFKKISEYLHDGEIVCIFPEGMLTRDGEMTAFRPGVERILEETPVPVIPMSLSGLWGSMFSRFGGRAINTLPRIRAKIS
ncbi:MAG: MFS transporter, partial [Sneathiella sp.]